VTPERARLFVALELPDPVRDALRTWRERSAARDDTWRPVPPAALHVTLCFLGSQPAREIDAIALACTAAVSEPSAPAPAAPLLTLAAVLTLPPRRPRVLAVALDDPGGALAALQGRLAQALAAGGWYELERRPYLAHVTVARARRGSPAQTGEPFAAPPALSFVAATISLLRSWPTDADSRYERLAAIELARSTPTHGPACAAR
jgi:2'-5' RNA ligase